MYYSIIDVQTLCKNKDKNSKLRNYYLLTITYTFTFSDNTAADLCIALQ